MFFLRFFLKKKKILKKLLQRFFKFSLIGLILNVGSILAGMFLLGVLKTPLYITYISLYIIVIGFSYILNAKYTFKANLNRKTAIFYYINYGVSFILSLIILKIFRDTLDWENYIIGILPMPFAVLWNFTVSYFVFKIKS